MTECKSQPSASPNRRKRRFLLPDLQLKIVLVTLSVAMIVLAVNFQLDLLALARLNDHPPPTLAGTFAALRDSLVWQLAWATAFAVPIALWVGVVYSFKFCGPLYSLLRQLRERVDGRWDQPYVLRKGDDLQYLKDAINASHAAMSRSLERQHELLLRVLRCMRGSGDATGGGEVGRLLEEIEEQSREHARRFGEGEAEATRAHEDCVQA